MRIVAYAVHYRTHTCGDLNKDAIGQQVTLAGWVNRRRDHGGLVFLDIRDRYGITQVICDPERSAEAHRVASEVRSEYVVQVSGKVVPRLAGAKYPRGSARLPCAKPALSRRVLCTTAVAPAAQAALDGCRIRSLLPDSPLFPR